MLATPAVSQADQGRQRAAGHPAPTVMAGVSPATHLRRRDREAAWPPAEARSSEERGAPVRCAAPAQCYCAWGETEAVTAPAGALCCPPDRPGPLRGASGQRTSAVSRCVGATGRLQRGPRPKVSLFPERSVHFCTVHKIREDRVLPCTGGTITPALSWVGVSSIEFIKRWS